MSDKSNLDLDVDNYSINDLKKFFKITDTDTIPIINDKIDDTSNKLLFSDGSSYSNDTKRQILKFINKAKDAIISHKTKDKDLIITEAVRKTNQMVSDEPYFVQKINTYPDKKVNQASFSFKTRQLVLNSIYSDTGLNNGADTFTFTFPETIKNVMGLTLGSLQYPNVELAFSDYKGNNLMYIQENYTNTTDANSNPTTSNVDGKTATIRLPPGTYGVSDFPPALQNQINLALGYPTTGTDSSTTSIFDLPRYSVVINQNSYNTTITNNLDPIKTQYPLALAYSKTFNGNNDFIGNYTIVFEKPTWTSNAALVCVNGVSDNPLDPNFTRINDNFKNNILPYRSLGYQMGYRDIIYSGKTSYTSLSVYYNNIINYVYFSLNDYVQNRIDEVTGVFFDSVFDKNILALCPITSQPFTSTFDSNANFIYKTRNYTGPVNLNKITVRFYDPNGFVAQLNGTPFSIVLELKILYDNPAVSGEAISTPF